MSAKEEEKDTATTAEAAADESLSKKPKTLTFPHDFPYCRTFFQSTRNDDNDNTSNDTDWNHCLVGLLFSAAWCPDCQPVVPLIANLLQTAQAKTKDKDNLLQVVILYVASETSAEQVSDFLGPNPPFQVIPFDDANAKERADLKFHFGTCAAKETAAVGLTADTRKAGIPTLTLLDAVTGKVVCQDAVPDVVKADSDYEAVLAQWNTMLDEWKKNVKKQTTNGDDTKKEKGYNSTETKEEKKEEAATTTSKKSKKDPPGDKK